MTIEAILAQQTTKTNKIKQLFELGKTRTEVANIMNVGYGFVQNVYAKTYPDRINVRRRITRAGRNNRSALAFQIPTFNRKFGVEIEFFGTKTKRTLLNKIRSKGVEIQTESYNHQTRQHWKIVTDSSINASRGSGMEIVSPILQGEQGLLELQKVCEALKEWGGLINRSCGLHIHFNASEFQLSTWKNLYKNYITCETTIDSMMPNSRRANNNRFCKSLLYKLDNKQNAFQKIKSARTIEALAKAVSGRNRYFKINPESYFRHKSVEFRQHSGTIEYSKISNWILFLHGMVSYSEAGKTIENGRFDTMKEFMTNDNHNFYYNRIQDLAA